MPRRCRGFSCSVTMFRRFFVLTILLLFWLYEVVPLHVCATVCFILYTVTGGWRTLRMLYYTLPRDARAGVKLLSVKWRMRYLRKNNLTVPRLFSRLVEKHPDKQMLICNDVFYTFQQVENLSNQVANYFKSQGFGYGDVVGLMMESRAEFVVMWLGLSKLGCVTALINTNLRNQSLVHCIKVAQPKALIVGSEFVEAVDSIRNELSDDYSYFYSGPALPLDQRPSLMTYLDEQLPKCQTAPPPTPPQATPNDSLMYIYTSGTTGLPKAAVITHFRFCYMAWGVAAAFAIDVPRDILYVCLPLYHTSGGILGVGQAVLNGNTIVIRPKFSASRYWSDCIKYQCTVGQYIGEVCRYLLAQPESQHDRQHKVRLMIGNGLRPHIWQEFVKRFAIPQIGEFYGATEGNCSVMNTDNKAGAVGFMTLIMPFLYPIMLIRVDPSSGEIVRDSNGLCVSCGPHQIGHLVGKIVSSDPGRRFDGYLDQSASAKKIVRDVVRHGDSAFLSGDLLERDELGYLYFRDRTGDTFRWKGENVSTTEVEAVLMQQFNNADVVVYGVSVSGQEGTAGMAAVAVAPDQQHLTTDPACLQRLYSQLRAALPPYALPIFLRVISTDHAYKTGTFKLKKFDLQKEGFNPCKVSEPLFILDHQQKTYTPLSSQLHSDLIGGNLRL